MKETVHQSSFLSIPRGGSTFISERDEILRRNFSGCVIRTIESVTQMRATNQEWDNRLREFYGLATAVSLRSKPEDKNEFDREQIVAMIDCFARTDSPVGQVLRRMDIARGMYSAQEIKSLIKKGNRVAVFIDEKVGHAAHVGLDENEEFMSLSDQNYQLDLEDKVHNVIVFSLRKKYPQSLSEQKATQQPLL